MMWCRPKRPDLLPEVLREFELYGVDAVREKLDTFFGNRDSLLPFGNATVKRGEMQDWIKWKAEADAYWLAYWLKVGVIAAVVAAVAAVVAAFPVVRDWIR
jgi:hypothetical protein